jgi:hypothetical protein
VIFLAHRDCFFVMAARLTAIWSAALERSCNAALQSLAAAVARDPPLCRGCDGLQVIR